MPAVVESTRMKSRHAAALALVGWYLMLPPMADDLDSSCFATASVPDTLWELSPTEVNRIRCHREGHEVQYDAPLSKWAQLSVSSFETLKACQAEYEKYEKYQAPAPVDNQEEQSRFMAKLEFDDEAKSNPSEEELQLRAKTIRVAIHQRIGDAKCIETDDPRLKEK